MSDEPILITGSDEPTVYEIRLKGHVGSQWTDWFQGLTITREANGDTLLTGPVADQAALHGLFKKVRDLALPLLSVNEVTPAPSGEPEVKPQAETDCVTKKDGDGEEKA